MMIMKCKSNKKVVRKAFSLIELLVVVSIIAILGGLAIGGYVAAMGTAKEAKTKTAIQAMAITLESIKAKKGFYPQVNADNMVNNVCWIAIEKVSGTENTPDPNTLTCTLSFKPPIKSLAPIVFDSYANKVLAEEFVKIVDLTDFVRTNCAFVIADSYRRYYLKDGWGYPIYYNSPGVYNTMSFDLVSTGKDGLIGDPKDAKKLFKVETAQVTLEANATDLKELGTVDDIINK